MSLDNGYETVLENFEPPEWKVLQELAHSNHEYFSTHKDENGLRLASTHAAILDTISEIRPLYNDIVKLAPQFDFDDVTPGNGYRSFLYLIDQSILHAGAVARQIYTTRDSIIFRKTHYMKEIEACLQLIASLNTFLHHVKTLFEWSQPTFDDKLSLFASEKHSPQELLRSAKNIDQFCFYGRGLAFQFADGMKYLLRTIMVAMASFSEMYYTNNSIFHRCVNSMKYIIDPEARARRVVNLSQRADVQFCKAFWQLNETNYVQMVPFMMIPKLQINQVISIPPEVLTLDDAQVTIPIPSSHVGKKPIHIKLLSAKRRIGMVGSATAGGELYGPSDTLLFHCHGGGFVAQSSRSHEIYLREWVMQLDVPLVSVDYSLAPEAPFPRALEEIVYTYAWALKHANSFLGSTAKKVIFIGDSAGANLILGLTTRCIDFNIRMPDGIFMAYVPVLVEFIPSPSKMLGLTDPMLPFGFMMRCLRAYTHGDSKIGLKDRDTEIESLKLDTESFEEVSESDLIALALSPNGEGSNEQKLASLPSDTTLNSVSLNDADGAQGPAADVSKNETRSQEYVRKFLNLYNNAMTRKSQTSPLSGTHGNDFKNHSDSENTFSLFGLTFGRDNRQTRELDTDEVRDIVEEFAFDVPRDPLLSPYRLSDDILTQFPPVKILSTNLDPCLDDCVMFARKLKFLGNNISLDILSGLPHGFLSFSVMSKEAHAGSELCIKRIQELINM